MKEPKTYLIKINRKTLKANEDAGQTKVFDYISSTGTITVRVKHDSLEADDDRIKMVSRQTSMSSKEKTVYSTTYFVGAMSFKELHELADKLKKRFGKHFSFVFENQFQELNFMRPIPPYSFEYRRTKVKCSYCDSSFTHDKLKSDSMEDDDHYSHSDKICPVCGEWECCQLEYESLEGILLTKAGLPRLVVG